MYECRHYAPVAQQRCRDKPVCDLLRRMPCEASPVNPSLSLRKQQLELWITEHVGQRVPQATGPR